LASILPLRLWEIDSVVHYGHMNNAQFFEIEGLLVVVTQESGEWSGRSLPLGQSYPPLKAMNQGEELTRVEFLEKLKERYPDSKMASLF